MTDRRKFYARQVETLTAEVERLRRRTRGYVMVELVSFVLMVLGMVASALNAWNPVWIGLALTMGAMYAVVRWYDVKASHRMAEQEGFCRVYKRELDYLGGEFQTLPSGVEYADSEHPYATDMDVFGRDSFFQRINRTVTTGGRDLLASELARTELHTFTEISERHEALAWLAEQEALRTRFMAMGGKESIDTCNVLAALRAAGEVKIPRFPLSKISLGVGLLSLVCFYSLVILAYLGRLPWTMPLLWALLQATLVAWLCARSLKLTAHAVSKILAQLRTYRDLIMLITETPMQGRGLQIIVCMLTDGRTNAAHSFAVLKEILDGIDRRNEIWIPVSNTLFLGDFLLVRRFLRWRECYMSCTEQWIAAVSRFDMLVSMATFQYNHPEAVCPEVVDASEVVFEAEGLWHPFLGVSAVRNDFTIVDSHYYIITGANMAGKSTFLRSVGVNCILALCGLPVFAHRLRLSRFSLFSSMRTSDALSHGISYFNAELLRLRRLIDFCHSRSHTLIILDEILKGTNSLDKLNGSRLFLRHIASLPVTGIVATHDLELSHMSDECPTRFHSYCFEIGLSADVTYSYSITPGVARNQNATFLLRRMLEEGI